MKKIENTTWYVPDSDSTIEQDINIKNLDMSIALNCCLNFRTAMDIGANVGLWSKPLTRYFNKTIIFEPLKNHYECLFKNLESINSSKYDFYNQCLSDMEKTVTMERADINCGQSRVIDELNSFLPKYKKWQKGDQITKKAMPLDKFIDKYENLDFIKIDVEGHEAKVLKGGIETIKKHKPIIMLECFGAHRHINQQHKGKKLENLIQSVLSEVDYWPIPNRKNMLVKSFKYGKKEINLPKKFSKKQVNFLFCHSSSYERVLEKYAQFWSNHKK